MNKFIYIVAFIYQLFFVFLAFSLIIYQQLLDGSLYSIYNNYPVILTSYTSNFKEIGDPTYCYGPWSCLVKTCYFATNNNTAIIGNTFTYDVTNNTCSRLKYSSHAISYLYQMNSITSFIIPLIILATSLELVSIPLAILSRKIEMFLIKFIYIFINLVMLLIELSIFFLYDISRTKFLGIDQPPFFITLWYYIIHSTVAITLFFSHIYTIIIIYRKKRAYLFIN
jgi:hypothetical protein